MTNYSNIPFKKKSFRLKLISMILNVTVCAVSIPYMSLYAAASSYDSDYSASDDVVSAADNSELSNPQTNDNIGTVIAAFSISLAFMGLTLEREKK